MAAGSWRRVPQPSSGCSSSWGPLADVILDDVDFRVQAVDGLDRLLPRRPGLRHAHPHAAATVATARALPSWKRVSATSPTAIPADPGNIQGPQVGALQQDTFARIRRGKAEGARVVISSSRPARNSERAATSSPPSRRRRELRCGSPRPAGDLRAGAGRRFPFDDDDDAVRVANDSEYGLRRGRHLGLRGAGAGGRPSHPGRHGEHQRRRLGPAPMLLSAATRPVVWAAEHGIEGFEQYTRPRPTPADCLPRRAGPTAPNPQHQRSPVAPARRHQPDVASLLRRPSLLRRYPACSGGTQPAPEDPAPAPEVPSLLRRYPAMPLRSE